MKTWHAYTVSAVTAAVALAFLWASTISDTLALLYAVLSMVWIGLAAVWAFWIAPNVRRINR